VYRAAAEGTCRLSFFALMVLGCQMQLILEKSLNRQYMSQMTVSLVLMFAKADWLTGALLFAACCTSCNCCQVVMLMFA